LSQKSLKKNPLHVIRKGENSSKSWLENSKKAKKSWGGLGLSQRVVPFLLG